MKKNFTFFRMMLVAAFMAFTGFIANAQIISQYIETNSGTTPKGVEIWNNTSSTLDFSVNNLIIQKGANGGALSNDATVSTGTLAPGEVMVIGTTDIGTYLTSQGSSVLFVEKSFSFNGDDALAVVYGTTTTDVFGTPGSDPGSAWTGGSVSTANQNIQLSAGITSGSTGFTDPSTRFETVSTDPSAAGGLVGFGEAPSATSAPTLNYPSSLSGFTYEEGSGPSNEVSFTVSGSNLTADNVEVFNAGNDYEVSLTSGSGFGSSVTIPISGGSIASTTVYVRLKAGLSVATYNQTIMINNMTDGVGGPINCEGTVTAPVTTPDVIISEVYGGGGNSGATLTNDFIELYNTSATDIDISGWSVQYYSSTATGESNSVYELPSGSTIPAGKHFLIQCAAGSGGTEALPTVDASCEIMLGGSGGKVILYNTNTAQTITDLSSILNNSNFVDYAPYGTSAAPVWGGAMSSSPSSTTSASRNIEGSAARSTNALSYMYTGNIGNDFGALEPTPQNSSMLITGIKLNGKELSAKIYAANGQLFVNTDVAGTIEVFNAYGQKVAEKAATEGLNVIAVQKGLMIVKVGNRTAKVLVK